MEFLGSSISNSVQSAEPPRHPQWQVREHGGAMLIRETRSSCACRRNTASSETRRTDKGRSSPRWPFAHWNRESLAVPRTCSAHSVSVGSSMGPLRWPRMLNLAGSCAESLNSDFTCALRLRVSVRCSLQCCHQILICTIKIFDSSVITTSCAPRCGQKSDGP